MILIARSGFNQHPGHAVASLDKMLYDDYRAATQKIPILFMI